MRFVTLASGVVMFAWERDHKHSTHGMLPVGMEVLFFIEQKSMTLLVADRDLAFEVQDQCRLPVHSGGQSRRANERRCWWGLRKESHCGQCVRRRENDTGTPPGSPMRVDRRGGAAMGASKCAEEQAHSAGWTKTSNHWANRDPVPGSPSMRVPAGTHRRT